MIIPTPCQRHERNKYILARHSIQHNTNCKLAANKSKNEVQTTRKLLKARGTAKTKDCINSFDYKQCYEITFGAKNRVAL